MEKKSTSTEITKLTDFTSVQEATLWAKTIIDSGLLPNAITEPEQVITIVQHGKELGISPHVALNNIHVINGRPTLSSGIIGSLLKRRGIEWTWDDDFANLLKPDGTNELTPGGVTNRRTTIHFYWKSQVTNRVMDTKFSVTWAQMEIAGYVNKDNWKKYPKEMLRARCLSYATRALFPEVLSGFYTDVEMNDVPGYENTEVTLTDEGDVVILQQDKK